MSLPIIQSNYLMDVSFLADCFKPYGAHPYNAILKRISPLSHSDAILLGNLANFFLDELIHSPEASPDYKETMRRFFRSSPFEVALTTELDDPKKRKRFAEESRRQFDNIQTTISTSFNHPAISLPQEELMIEPTFISYRLGLQGRLDAIRNNYQSFIELKSGKMNGWNDQLSAVESHYIQLQLYAALIREIEQIESKGYLFYSKYPRLVYEPLDRETIDKALELRNKIVEIDLAISQTRDLEPIRQLFRAITPERLNERGLSDRFWEQYLSAPIREFASLFGKLNDTSEDYLVETYRFIVTEWYKGKAGCTEEEHLKEGRNLSKRASLSFKIEAGEAVEKLSVTKYLNTRWEPSSDSISIVCLTATSEDSIVQSNFRRGDLVWIYVEPTPDKEPLNRSITKGTIVEINTSDIYIQLQYSQRNKDCFDANKCYIVEQGESEVNNNAYFHGLFYFLDANAERRSLLLGEQPPRIQTDRIVQGSFQSDLERVLDKVEQCNDYFLLVGPPGSGKTSIALRAMIEQECRKPDSHILVLAFTNRAVDEICGSIGSLHPSYPILRMGSLAACDPEYHHLHYTKQFAEVSDRNEVIERLGQYRIVVSTVATFISKIHLFRFFRYDLAIFDEASQILEPQLLSVVCSKDSNGDNLIDRWVMIGDHKQLPAVVVQSDQESEITSSKLRSLGFVNFKESLFERLYKKVFSENRTDCFDQITVQGRMHPEVAEYTNQYYYGGALRPIPLEHQREKQLYNTHSSDGPEHLLSTYRTLFFNVEPEKTHHLCKQNRPEAELVGKIVAFVYNLYLKNGLTFDPKTTIGIIAPFRSQISLIRKILQELSNPLFNRITVDTVERYQGSQREIIIYSFCIAHPHQVNWITSSAKIDGHLIDRKLNVVLTRAKKQYILLGNAKILCKNNIFAHFMEHLQTKGCKFES